MEKLTIDGQDYEVLTFDRMTTQELNEKLTVDWDKFRQTLCDDLRPNAIDPTNPCVPINSVMPMIEYQAAEIARLNRVVEDMQALSQIKIVDNDGKPYLSPHGTNTGRWASECPDLYAKLLKRGEQNG